MPSGALNAGGVFATLSLDIANFNASLNKAKAQMTTASRAMSNASAETAKAVNGIGGVFSGIGAKSKAFFSGAAEDAKKFTQTMGIVGTVAGGALAFLGKKAVEGAADFEQTKIALTTMMGDADKAGNLLQDIAKFAAETPFEMPELATTTKQLMAFGFGADEAIGGMKTLGDISAGLNVPIGDLAYLFGTLKAQGKAMTIDIRQFAMRGLPIYDALAQVMGVSKDKVGDLVTAGKVGFPEVQKALESMVAEGGKFHGSMANQATSLKGLWSTLSDTMGFTLREIIGINLKGEVREGSIFDILRDKAQILIDFLDSHKEDIATFFTNIVNGISGMITAIGENAIFQAFVSALQTFGAWIMENQETALAFLKGLAIALGAVMVVTAVAGAIAALYSPLTLIVLAVALLYTAWTQNWGGIRDYLIIIWNWMKGVFEEIKQAWNSWGVHLWNSTKATFDMIWHIIKFVVQLITDTITVFILFFTGEWGAMWEAIKTGAQHAWDNIKGIFGSAITAVKEYITGMSNYFSDKFNEMWNKAKEIAEKIRHAIASAFDKDQRNSPSIADMVNDLSSFVTKNSFNFMPNIVPTSASTINQTINAQLSDGVDVNFLGEKMRFLMRANY